MTRVRLRIRIGIADPYRASLKPCDAGAASGLAPRRRVHRMPSRTQ